MLPDLEIPLPAFGPDRVLVVRDVPAAVFLAGLPENDEDHPAIERWLDDVLARASVRPRLSVELVRRLGITRDAAVRAYLLAVGWLPGPAVGVTVSAETPASEAREDWLPTLVDMPPRGIRQTVVTMAERWGTPPSRLLAMPISEFIVNAKLMTEQHDRGSGPINVPGGPDEIPATDVFARMR